MRRCVEGKEEDENDQDFEGDREVRLAVLRGHLTGVGV